MDPNRTVLRVESLEDRAVPAVYYVSTSGADVNPGTSEGAAWRTLQAAANRVNPGDRVEVLAGNYVGFNMTRDGTSAARITFAARPGAAVTTANTWNNQDGINLEGADFVTIDGFNVSNMPRTGIRSVLNQFVTIRNNVLDNNGRWGVLTGFSNDLLIEGNTATRSVAEHGIYVSNSGDRPVIRNNTIWGNRANGIHMNGDVSQGGDGVISGAVVENNVIHDNGLGGGSGINCDGVQNSRIQNNLIYNSWASGISLYRIDGGGPSSGNLVVNNTVIASAPGQTSSGRWAVNILNGAVNTTIRNNILYSYHSFRGAISITADSLSGLQSSHNATEDRFSTDGGSTVLTLAQWRSGTGQEAGSFTVSNPATLFVSTANGDYHLRTGSVAVDRGTATNAAKEDYEGDPRPNGNGVDIGCDEYAPIKEGSGGTGKGGGKVSGNDLAAFLLTLKRANKGGPLAADVTL